MEKQAIILVRVSTLVQDYQSQIYDLQKYGESLGYTKFHVIETKETAFADLNAKVGTNDMFKYIEQNPEYNTIIVTEISRLARRQSILHQLKEHCINKQIQIHIKDINFKLLDEHGHVQQQSEMIFTLYGMFAESEVKTKIERFKRERRELKAVGLSIGGKLLFGYDRMRLENKKNTLIINDEQANIVRQIYNWYLNGLNNAKNPSIKAISMECVKLGYHKYTHSKRNVNKLLKEEAYTGLKTTNNKYKNTKFGIVAGEPEYKVSNSIIKYPVILDNDTFDKVQTKLLINTTNADKDTKHTSILSKLIKCPSCGRSLQANYRNAQGMNKNSYRCTSRGDTVACASKNKSLPMNLVDSAVWSLIKTDLPALSKKISEINPDEQLELISNHLINLNEREQEIKNNIDENLAVLESVSKLRTSSKMELIKSTGVKIEKLETELDKIEKEKARIEIDKVLLNAKQTDIETVINDNIIEIENSKELIKKYINFFIDSIDIIEHNVKYTILELTIKDGMSSFLSSTIDDFSTKYGKVVEVRHLIINKVVTRQPKFAIWTNRGAKKSDIGLTVNDQIEIIHQHLIPRYNKYNDWHQLKKMNI
ncbi:recombinase family protein [Flavobacterium sp.]|uniref:recombinase family protein n=1 Tax=Flavobacterium sp. TaxID=239 RepID=UPI002ED991EB